MNLFNKSKQAKYIKSIEASGLFDNTVADAFPQTIVAKLVREHFANGGKKAIVINYDGARADGLLSLLQCKNEPLDEFCRYGAIAEIAREGGLYLTYAGGDIVKQHTSTMQGFASMLTGKWADEHGVDGAQVLNENTKTFLRELAEKGFKSHFIARWDDHFSCTYKREIAIAKEQNLPLQFTKCGENDETLQAEVKKALQNDDIIYAIYEAPDANGHAYHFGNENYHYTKAIAYCDKAAFEIVQLIKARANFEQENWLIIISSDHGGHMRWHGTQNITDRQTFLACNKKL
ncbi:MAG: alkaline phosphatase family protein [Clostridia bacterium]